MKHHIIIKALLGFALLMFGGQAAYAAVIEPADCTSGFPCWSGSFPVNPDADDVELITGASTELEEVYKNDVGDPDTGPLAGSYQTTFSNTAMDPDDALIEWVGPDTISCPECYLLVKDGSADPRWYIYGLDGSGLDWNGTDDLDLQDFWVDPPQGAISHVSLFATISSDNPAPGPLVIMAIGLIGMISLRGRVMKAS